MEEFLKMFNENRTAYCSSAIDLQPIMRQVYLCGWAWGYSFPP
jgi:hypothetical protein